MGRAGGLWLNDGLVHIDIARRLWATWRWDDMSVQYGSVSYRHTFELQTSMHKRSVNPYSTKAPRIFQYASKPSAEDTPQAQYRKLLSTPLTKLPSPVLELFKTLFANARSNIDQTSLEIFEFDWTNIVH